MLQASDRLLGYECLSVWARAQYKFATPILNEMVTDCIWQLNHFRFILDVGEVLKEFRKPHIHLLEDVRILSWVRNFQVCTHNS